MGAVARNRHVAESRQGCSTGARSLPPFSAGTSPTHGFLPWVQGRDDSKVRIQVTHSTSGKEPSGDVVVVLRVRVLVFVVARRRARSPLVAHSRHMALELDPQNKDARKRRIATTTPEVAQSAAKALEERIAANPDDFGLHRQLDDVYLARGRRDLPIVKDALPS